MRKIPELIIKKAFSIINRGNISYLEYISYEQPNYQIILNLWKEYRFLGPKYNPFLKENRQIEEIFKFHLQSPINHGIMYYSKNSSKAILFFKIDHYFFCLSIETQELPVKNKNFIAIYI